MRGSLSTDSSLWPQCWGLWGWALLGSGRCLAHWGLVGFLVEVSGSRFYVIIVRSTGPRWPCFASPPGFFSLGGAAVDAAASLGPLAWASLWRRAVVRCGGCWAGEEGRAFLESNVKKMSGPVPALLPSRDVFGAHLGTLVRYLVLLGLSWGPVGGC